MKYLFFDLDGTLTDPGEGITNSVMYALGKFGVHVEDRRELYRMIGPPLLYSFENYYGFDKEKSATALKYYREYFSARGIFENEIYDGIPEMLEKLKSHGAKIALATSKPDVYAEKILEHFGIKKYFDFIAGNTLEESRPEKNDVIRYALDNLPECYGNAVMVGDRSYDILGGKSFGLISVGVSYGYGSTGELKTAGADYIAESVSQLYDILLSLL